MLNEFLIQEYGYDEPIFINNLEVKDMSKKALRQAVSRLSKTGELAKFDTGIYYIPKPDRLLKRAFLDTTKVIIRKYITDGQQTYGYFTGLTAANQLALTTQVPTHLEICSNIESSKGRTVTVGNRTLRVKRPKMEVTSDNYKMLQLLDLIQDAEKWSELPEEGLISRLRSRITEEGLSRKELKTCILLYPGKTEQKIIEWELVYDFT